MSPQVIRTANCCVKIHDLSEGAVAAAILGRGGSRAPSPGLIVTPNMHHLALLEKSSVLASAYKRASLVLADGWPVVVLAKLLGSRIRYRTTGSGLVECLSSIRGLGMAVTLIGGSSAESNASAVAAFRRMGWRASGEVAPQLELAVDQRRQALISRVVEKKPDLVIIGVGTPKQEAVALEILDAGFTGWILCAGAGIDFLSGQISRCPVWLRHLGLEWLHRIAMEPKRLFIRYASDVSPFMTVFIRSLKGVVRL